MKITTFRIGITSLSVNIILYILSVIQALGVGHGSSGVFFVKLFMIFNFPIFRLVSLFQFSGGVFLVILLSTFFHTTLAWCYLLLSKRKAKSMNTIVLMIFIINLFFLPSLTFGEGESLSFLRNEMAKGYFEALPHIKIAKFYYDRGNKLLAFYLLEDVRRHLVPSQEFDKAFYKIFSQEFEQRSKVEFPYSDKELPSMEKLLSEVLNYLSEEPQKAEQILISAIEKYPKVGEFYFHLAIIYQNKNMFTKAKEFFMKAAGRSPYNPHIQAWVGRYFLKVEKKPEEALGYYLNAYFLDPHFYETEYVESRVRMINWESASEIVNDFDRKNSLGDLLAHENPVVVLEALKVIKSKWQSRYLEKIMLLLEHDDRAVRWEATMVLKERLAESSDNQITMLLSDNDFRKRGLATYIAVYKWREKSFPYIKELLSQEITLVQYDAIEGGEKGKQFLMSLSLKGLHPRTQAIIDYEREPHKDEKQN